MSDFEILRIMVGLSLCMWLLAAIAFMPSYVRALTRQDGRVAFVIATTVLALTNTLEAYIYFDVLWVHDSPRLTRLALFAIPTSLMIRAITHASLAWWVMYGPRKDKPL